ncbi:GntR family transcriptional regulator [Microbispora sp. ATCC PTA-5024]|uniref:GntR family transcriptional regulator n=1 Tax=Microbispora sp. ATCC PTA-5024 TaxID=316330 RepID=UPI0003DD70AB|nr:GntR family transcriptional regulator [Microbispora sp. ATCC PTA-5024]ETK38146.1 GntR family transcriptional regulator [Microbispora sp. ATCC PTA-5024]
MGGGPYRAQRPGRSGLPPGRSGPPPGGERRSLRERVAEGIRDALAAGEMRPGVVYSAPALAARFGVSATPVREAMLDLAKEGLVEAVRNKGFRVVELSERDVGEVMEIRRLLEVPAVAGLAGRLRGEEVEELRALAEEAAAAARDGDPLAYAAADQRFHLALLETAGNARLVEIVRDLRGRTRLFGARGGAPPSGADRERLDLLDALARGDADAAAHIMELRLRRP